MEKEYNIKEEKDKCIQDKVHEEEKRINQKKNKSEKE